MNSKQSLIAGGILGFLAVALGAFGAHALQEVLNETNRTDTYELASRYLFYHAIVLLIVGAIQQHINKSLLRISSILILSGVSIFSGSLYGLSISGITKLGMITPIGGLLMLGGWALAIVSFINSK